MSTRADTLPLMVWLSGASGFVGSAVEQRLRQSGHNVVRLVRRASRLESELQWSPQAGIVDARASGMRCDAVIHLAGENMSGARFSERRKQLLWESRVQATEQLCKSLCARTAKPEVLICASGVGFYGDGGDRELTEHSEQGKDFVARLAGAWEEACGAARAAGMRVVNLRTGLVLHPSGGALKRMLLPFRAGVGGRLGSGRHFVSWISLRDLVSVIEFALTTKQLSGAINCVSPQPLMNREFTKVLAGALHRPAILPVPEMLLKLVFGEGMAEMILTSSRAKPLRLIEAGFKFEDRDLGQTLRCMLK